MCSNRATQIAGRTITRLRRGAADHQEAQSRDVAASFNTGAERVAAVDRGDREGARRGRSADDHRGTEKRTAPRCSNSRSNTGSARRRSNYYIARSTKARRRRKSGRDEARPRYEAIREAQEELTEASGGWQQDAGDDRARRSTAAAMAALNYGAVAGQSRAGAAASRRRKSPRVDRQMKLNLATMAATEPALGTLDQWIKTNVGDTKAVEYGMALHVRSD